MIWRLGSRRRLRTTGERGAVLVEAALITPIVALLLFGIIEFGLLLNRELSASNATREGARSAAAAAPIGGGSQTLIFGRIRDSLNSFAPADVEQIAVYEADPSTGYPIATGSALCPIGTTCNAFNPASGESEFAKTGACRWRCKFWTPSNSANWAGVEGAVLGDSAWNIDSVNGCIPTSNPSDKRTRLGVYVALNYEAITPLIGNIIGNERAVQDHTSIRVEPKQGAAPC